nr:phage terminase large subunit [Lactiplantibacillus argentoratensis]
MVKYLGCKAQCQYQQDQHLVELKKAINDFHLARYFKYNESLPEITYLPTGQKIIFRGLDDPLKLTSVNVLTGELCWLWVEEAMKLNHLASYKR